MRPDQSLTGVEEAAERVLLVWMLAHRRASLSKLADFLAARSMGARPAAVAAVSAAVGRLRQVGAVVARGRLKTTLSDSGHRRALEALGLSDLPPGRAVGWGWAKKLLLVRALGLPVTPTIVRDAGHEQWLAAFLLARRHGLSLRGELGLVRVARAVLLADLGIEEDVKLTSDRALRAVVLGANAAKGTPSAAAIVPAARPEPPPSSNPGGGAPDLPSFARQVNESARGAPSGRWGDDKVFISHVWEEFRRRGHAGSMSYDGFQGNLLAAHRSRLVHLSRADLIEEMPARDVGASELSDWTSTFHFVRFTLDGAGSANG